MAHHLHLREPLACVIDSVDGAHNLTNLSSVRVFTLNFIFEILLQGLVLLLNAFNVSLQVAHYPLLLVEFGCHLSKGLPLVFFDLLHAGVDCSLTLVQLFVFIL